MSYDLEALEKETDIIARAFSIVKKEFSALKRTGLDVKNSLASIDTSLKKVMKEVEKLQPCGAYVDKLGDFCKTLQAELDEEKVHFRTRFTDDLAKKLTQHNLELKGTFPEFRIGVLTLVFNFEEKEGTLYYGPKIYSLGTVILDADKMQGKILRSIEDLNSPLAPDNEFIGLLYNAYDRAIKCNNYETGSEVGIYELLPEFVLLIQPDAFRKDPTKDHFKNYTKMNFSYNLYKLKERTYNGYELQLHIATREETKKTYAHLWVPQNERGEGVHYGGLRFKKL